MTIKRIFDKALFFQALADQTRLRLLNLLGEDEVCVCFLVAALDTNQPKISRHLSYLRKAGIVGARREGKWIHYRIVQPSDPQAAAILRDIREWLASDQAMQRDRSRLRGICCGPTLPIQLQGAPLPALAISRDRTSGPN